MGKPLIVHADTDVPLEKAGFEKDQVPGPKILFGYFFAEPDLTGYGSG